jgi:hypothetical protein
MFQQHHRQAGSITFRQISSIVASDFPLSLQLQCTFRIALRNVGQIDLRNAGLQHLKHACEIFITTTRKSPELSRVNSIHALRRAAE